MKWCRWVVGVLLTVGVAPVVRAQAVPGERPAAPAVPSAGRDTEPATGRINGRVVDAASGRPLPFVNVLLDSTRRGAATDLDGRFEIRGVSPGLHYAVARLIGFRPSRRDSIRVEAGRAVSISFALASAPTTLSAVAVTAEAPRQARDDASLLAIQKNAPSVSDGISAEAMQRSPTSNAADAITRVPGVSVVDGRFTVIRGLGERYSNTLLNGAELPSPEPTRKIVPLDIFPASLLESIVTTKAATPDRPGDFSGGSVEIKTKEFPDERVAQVNVTLGGNSLTTFHERSYPTLAGLEQLGITGAARDAPLEPSFSRPVSDRLAQSIRAVWVPPVQSAGPDMKAGLNLGDQFTLFGAPLGVLAVGSYSISHGAAPNRLFVFLNSTTQPAERAFTYNETNSIVDIGVILNATYRVRPTQKIGIKNTYTRNVEDFYLVANGFTIEKSAQQIRGYQTRFVVRDLWQTQLSGDHLLGWLGNSRFEWKGTLGRARRLEPDTRQAPYLRSSNDSSFVLSLGLGANIAVRNLEDRLQSVGADWSIPFRFRRSLDGQFKFGGLSRLRVRGFDSEFFRYQEASLPNGAPARSPTLFTLPPNQMFAPENIGSLISIWRYKERAGAYRVEEIVDAGYVMLDLPLNRRLRFVGGARYEEWSLKLRVDPNSTPRSQQNVDRSNPDLLTSANVTIKLTERTNLRAAWFSSVSRPDPREVSSDEYDPVLGECTQRGNPELQRVRIDNYDLRWETYPGVGEIISISAYMKQFEHPIIEVISGAGSSGCGVTFINANQAVSTGMEFEARKALSFLPGSLRQLSASLNVTLARSNATIPIDFGYFPGDLQLAGQSPVLVNAALYFDGNNRSSSWSLLANYFGDRITRYGVAARDTLAAREQAPDVLERGRWSIDVKYSRRIGRANVTIAARNLLDNDAVFYQVAKTGTAIVGRVPKGVGLSTGIGYDF